MPLRSPRSPRGFTGLLIPLVLSVLATAPLEAQLGGLIRRATERKAEEKATEKVEDRANVGMLSDPVFDGTTVELTDALLDRYVAAATKARDARAARQAESQALLDRAIAIEDSGRALENPADRQRFYDAERRWSDCADEAREAEREAAEKRMEAMQARIMANPMAAQNDPTFKKMAQLMQRMSAAQGRGDQAEVERLQGELQRTMQGMVGDSASAAKAVTAKCGARVTQPAWMLRQEALKARGDSLRRVSSAMVTSAPTAAELGVTARQAAMVHERIASWLNGMRRDAPLTTRFTRAEYDRLVARRAALRRVVSD